VGPYNNWHCEKLKCFQGACQQKQHTGTQIASCADFGWLHVCNEGPGHGRGTVVLCRQRQLPDKISRGVILPTVLSFLVFLLLSVGECAPGPCRNQSCVMCGFGVMRTKKQPLLITQHWLSSDLISTLRPRPLCCTAASAFHRI